MGYIKGVRSVNDKMDMDKMYKLLTNDKDIADIPILFIFRVAVAMFKIINSGECMYHIDDLS